MLDLLKNVRVIDLSTVVLGRYATQIIADLGAEVIKVEPKTGDIFRMARPGGDGAGFLNLNRNKRSIALDLMEQENQEILYSLIANADVLVHNMRPNSAAKLGIDYASIRRVKEDIVYCSSRGFGPGLYGDEPAYDDCIQAASGLAWLNADTNGEPKFLRTVLCDKLAGLHLAIAIASGLAAHARTGEGCEIETPMYEAMASFLLIEQLSGQTFIPPMPDRGYARLDAEGRRPYRTKDGYAAIMPYTAKHWQRFLRLVGYDSEVEADIVTDDEKRSANIEMLYKLIVRAAPERTTAEWLHILREQDIPCAPVNRIEELADEPHLAGSGFFETLTHPTEGELLYPKSPFFSGTANSTADRSPPVLNSDREAILDEIPRKNSVHST